jgi:hypothetical protein
MKSYVRIGLVTQRKATMRAAVRRVTIASATLGAAIAGIVLPGVSASAATVYFVDNTNPSVCSDSGTGTTMAQPFCTLTKAAAKAASGDTVQVIAGTYTANSVSPASGVTFTANLRQD